MTEVPAFRTARDVYLRFLGAIYVSAFVSFGCQLRGLIGERGVLPTAPFFESLAPRLGLSRFFLLPTLAWISASDGFLLFLSVAGAVLGILVVAGFRTKYLLPILWVFYLSLVNAGGVFMGYQWEALLLEAGFLACFLAASRTPSRAWIWLHWWLLFRLLFASGVVKLLSADPTWHNLTALEYHFETQPLPTPLAWYANQLPKACLKAMTVFMFFVELVVPFLFFFGRRARLVAFLFSTMFQIGILLTGNYTYFNALTIALGILLLDDKTLGRVGVPAPRPWAFRATPWIAGCLFLLGALELGNQAGFHELDFFLEPAERLRIVSSYGLFAVMTTERDELVIEGSRDGATWKEYEFRWKPGDVFRAPGWVAPHQPRLDWQAWFAALGQFEDHRWLEGLLARILEGEPRVLALLGKNPFPDAPPRYARVQRYRYRFTDWETRRKTGAWWRRELLGPYAPPVSLRD